MHFHSQSSYDYEDKSVTDEELIDGLVAHGIAAVAITDHHKIDEARVKNLQNISNGRVLILPGIEFRSELGGSELMHFIGIFSDKSDISYIWKQLQVLCKIDDADIERRGGYEKTFCDFKETAKTVHEMGQIFKSALTKCLGRVIQTQAQGILLLPLFNGYGRETRFKRKTYAKGKKISRHVASEEKEGMTYRQ